MPKCYSPSEIRYLIENHQLPPKYIGRKLKRSAGGIKAMIHRLKEDGRIEAPKPKKYEKIYYRWEIQPKSPTLT